MGLNASSYRYLPLTARINQNIIQPKANEEEKKPKSQFSDTEQTFVDKSSDMQNQMEILGNNNISFIDFQSTIAQLKKPKTNVPNNPVHTQAIGEDGDNNFTQAVGEGGMHTQAIGENGQDPIVVTQAIGENGQDPIVVTQAIGENGQDPIVVTQAIGESGDNNFTQAIGENGQADPIVVTQAIGESGDNNFTQAIGEDGNPITPISPIPSSISVPKNAEVKINDDGTIDVIITKPDLLSNSSAQTVMHYDKDGNLLTRTEYSAFNEKTGTRTTLIYDKDDNMTGGEIKFQNGKTVSLPANSVIKYVQKMNGNIMETTIDVITTETFSNVDIYDSTQTFIDQKITTIHYDREGNKTGTNVVTKTRNPNTTIDINYGVAPGYFYVQPPVLGGKISFDTGAKDFIIPEGASINFKDGKIIVSYEMGTQLIKVTLGNNGIEKTEFEPLNFANDKEEYKLSDLSYQLANDEENSNTDIQPKVKAILGNNNPFVLQKQFKTF